MRQWSCILMLVLVWSGCTCGSKDEGAEQAPVAAAEPQMPSADAPLRELTDAEGRLKVSNETYGALPLPVGLKLHREDKFLRVYRTRVPAKLLLQYFGPLLITGRVDEIEGGAVYRRANVRGAETAPFKLDVSIKELSGGKTRVAITRFPDSPAAVADPVEPPKDTNDYWKTQQ